jgi:hypothetical protein
MEHLTQHAAIRMQQRGIKEETLNCLFQYGKKTYDRRGCLVVYFDKQARKRIQLNQYENIPPKSIQAWMDTYAVVTVDGEILTVGHRFKKIKRH